MWAGMEPLSDGDSDARAQAEWWSLSASEYLEDHGSVLGEEDFVWGPEGLREAEAGLLGDVAGQRVLEFGAGAAQCSRFLRSRGAEVIATDIAEGMLAQGREIDARRGTQVPMAVADARSLPFASSTFDAAFTSFGAVAFVEELLPLWREVARVLRPGGRLVYSAPHPIRWMFPDSPLRRDMTVTTPYFAREPYVERDDSDRLIYCEFHHTMEDHLTALLAAGFRLTGLLEPRWPQGRRVVWGSWGPERSPWIPGTLIVSAVLDGQ